MTQPAPNSNAEAAPSATMKSAPGSPPKIHARPRTSPSVPIVPPSDTKAMAVTLVPGNKPLSVTMVDHSSWFTTTNILAVFTFGAILWQVFIYERQRKLMQSMSNMQRIDLIARTAPSVIGNACAQAHKPPAALVTYPGQSHPQTPPPVVQAEYNLQSCTGSEQFPEIGLYVLKERKLATVANLKFDGNPETIGSTNTIVYFYLGCPQASATPSNWVPIDRFQFGNQYKILDDWLKNGLQTKDYHYILVAFRKTPEGKVIRYQLTPSGQSLLFPNEASF